MLNVLTFILQLRKNHKKTSTKKFTRPRIEPGPPPPRRWSEAGIWIYLAQIKNQWRMDGSPGDVSEEPVTFEKRKKGWRMSCDVGEATEGLENQL